VSALRRYADTPLRRYAVTPLRRYAVTPLRRYADTPTRRHADTPTRRHAVTPSRLELLHQSYSRLWRSRQRLDQMAGTFALFVHLYSQHSGELGFEENDRP
jgi:hypothetical protein